MVVTVKVTNIYGKMNFNRWTLAITAVPTTLTSRFPTTGYARVLSFIFIRRELGGTGTGCLFQFTNCVVGPVTMNYSPDWTKTGFSFILINCFMFRHSTLIEQGLYLPNLANVY